MPQRQLLVPRVREVQAVLLAALLGLPQRNQMPW